MRIAQVAPLSESVPPRLYGGTERVVALLTDELVRRGHTITLFASGDSQTRARLVAPCARAQRLSQSCDPLAAHLLMLELVAKQSSEFDLIHFHVAPLHFSLARRLHTPHVTTLHGRLDLVEIRDLYNEFQDLPLVSVSDAQRAPLPRLNWVDTVYHGLDAGRLRFHSRPGHYLAFLGRISPEKRADRAIAIAKAAGMPLRIAAKVDPIDARYFAETIEPLLDHPLIEFTGEIPDSRKSEFLGNARALLFPIDWPEPFGLVMIEALACGTPVVAFRGGSVTEVLEHGVNGFVVDSIDEAVDAAARVSDLDRRACRRSFERRFTAARMAADYLEVYRGLTASSRTGHVA